MDLILYHFDSCPYCYRVRQAIEKLEIEKLVECRDIYENEAYLEELLEINHGSKQVPCLLIDGKPMLESEDIIEFLTNEFS